MPDAGISSNPSVAEPGSACCAGFVGRTLELDYVFEQIHKRQCVSITGAHGIGKTTFLRRIMEEGAQNSSVSSGYNKLFLYLQADSSLVSTAAFVQRVLELIRERRPSAEYRDRGSPQRCLLDCLDGLSPEELVLLLDDFDASVGFVGDTFGFLSFLRLVASDRDVSIVTASIVELHKCCDSRGPSSPFANIFTTVELQPLMDVEFDAFSS